MGDVRKQFSAIAVTDQLLDQIAEALADQDSSSLGSTWFLDKATAQVTVRMQDYEFDDQDGDEVASDNLIEIGSLSSREWYLDMADFAAGIDVAGASTALQRALEGRGAFRRFRNVLYDQYEGLVPLWNQFRDTRGRRKAVEWLMDERLITDAEAQNLLSEHADPELRAVDDKSNSGLSRHFSLSNAEGPNSNDLPMLLRRLADEIEGQQIKPEDLLDVVFSSDEITEFGAWWTATVYWSVHED